MPSLTLRYQTKQFDSTAPSISGIANAFSPTVGGTNFVVSGLNFVNGATVKVAGVDAGAVFVNSTTLNCVSPAGTFGQSNVVVTNPDTQSATSVNGMTYYQSANPGIAAIGGYDATSAIAAFGISVNRANTSYYPIAVGGSQPVGGPAATQTALIGVNDNGVKGLIIQQIVNQFVGGNGPRKWNADWTAGTAVVVSASTGADGTANIGDLNVTAAGYGPYGQILSNIEYCFSSYLRSATGSPQQMVYIDLANTGVSLATAPASSDWQIVQLTNGANVRQYFDVCDCRDYSTHGGTAAMSRHVVADFAKFELGQWRSLCPIAANGMRAGDRPNFAFINNFKASNGQFVLYFDFYPMMDLAQNVYRGVDTTPQTAYNVFGWDRAAQIGSNWARINKNGTVSVTIEAGAVYTTSGALTFSKNDRIRIQITVGNNIPSVVTWSRNGGAFTDLILPTVPDVPNAQGTGLATMCGSNSQFNNLGNSMQLPCILSEFRAYPVPVASGNL